MFALRAEALREEREKERYERLNAELCRRLTRRTEREARRSLSSVLVGFGAHAVAQKENA